MNKKLIVTDIDGTLISHNWKILESTKEQFTRLQEEGHIIAIASGRPVDGVMFYAEEIGLPKYGGYVVAYNGGRIVNVKTGEEVYSADLDKSILIKAQQYALSNGLGMVAYDNGIIIQGTVENIYMKGEKEACKMKATYVADFTALECRSPKAIISCDVDMAKKHLPVIEKMFENTANVFRSEPYFIEITPKGLDKAAAVKELAESLGIDIENTVCFGDGYNDVSMLKAAGVGIAMENACSEAKEAADYITLSCNDGGIAYAIENILKI